MSTELKILGGSDTFCLLPKEDGLIKYQERIRQKFTEKNWDYYSDTGAKIWALIYQTGRPEDKTQIKTEITELLGNRISGKPPYFDIAIYNDGKFVVCGTDFPNFKWHNETHIVTENLIKYLDSEQDFPSEQKKAVYQIIMGENAVYVPPLITLSTPNLSITAPAYDNVRPSSATQINSNYTTSISWTPTNSDNKFQEGNNEGTFTLTSKSGYIFGSNSAIINAESINGSRTDNDTILTVIKAFNIVKPVEIVEGIFTDPRDGKAYPYKKMPDGKIWMTENLQYAGNGAIGYKEVSYNKANQSADGLMYLLDQVPTAAPSGWHVANFDEWKNLLKAMGGTGVNYGQNFDLRSALFKYNSWYANGNYTIENYPGKETYYKTFNYLATPNRFGFSFLPNGKVNASNAHTARDYEAHLWAGTTYILYCQSPFSGIAFTSATSSYKQWRFGIRCVKD